MTPAVKIPVERKRFAALRALGNHDGCTAIVPLLNVQFASNAVSAMSPPKSMPSISGATRKHETFSSTPLHFSTGP